jgi:glycine dehydrogenase subunit 2
MAARGAALKLQRPQRCAGQVLIQYAGARIGHDIDGATHRIGGDWRPAGHRTLAETAVLNANYLKALVEGEYKVKYPRRCMHEFVAQGDLAEGVHTLDIAKRLIDLGFHPPTIYFPLIVPEALMIEPTETESKETLDEFATALLRIAEEARSEPELLRRAPTTTPVGRLDEVAAARNPILCFKD